MEDIALPTWAVNTPAMAVASSLSRHLLHVFEDAARSEAEEAIKLQKVQRELVDADAVHREAAEQNDFGSTESDSENEDEGASSQQGRAAAKAEPDADTASVASSDSDASRDDAVGRAHFLFGGSTTGTRRYARLLSQGHGSPRPSAALGPAKTAGSLAGTCYTDLLQDSRVQLLFRLSRFNEMAAGENVMVSPGNATALIALLGCAVNCTCLPEEATRGFFMECSSLYTALIGRLPTLQYAPSLDVQGFVASVVACGMKLRAILETNSSAPTGAYGTADGARHTSSGRSTPRASVALSGFSARMIDPVLVSCVPNAIEDCVRNPVALGVLEGLAYTYSRAPVCFAPELVAHLNNLTDAFALSEQRRELAYKKLLSLLLEAMSCSKVIDHERTNNWVTAIIQEDYVVRGLFQREVLHARVVAATLTLLIRQYQELAQECAEQAGGVDGVPDFTEGDQLIELVWKALQDGLSVWDGTPKAALTLYGANVRVVLENLLLVEAERVRCYLVITNATNAHHQRLLAEHSLLSFPSSTQPAAAATPGTGAAAHPVPPYTPSVQEERLRVRIAANVVQFLLMPTSVVNLPNTTNCGAARQGPSSLQRTLTELCARLLRLVCADRVKLGKPGESVPTASATIFAAEAGAGNAEPHTEAGVATGVQVEMNARQPHSSSGEDATASVRFSSRYYNRVEQIVRTLITTVMQGATTETGAIAQAPLTTSATAAGENGLVVAATVCLQSFCASDATVGSFVVSEVMDAIQSMLTTITAHAEFPSEDTAARLSLCVDTLRSVLVPGGDVQGSVLEAAAIRQYCQLLSDTYENLLRLEVVENKALKTSTSPSAVAALLPTLNMRVVVDAYWRLTVSLHERLLTLASEALLVTNDRARKAQYLDQLNEESEAVRVLLLEVIQCLVRVAWPGSGVLYQQPGKAGGVKAPGTPSAKPAAMAPFALAVMAPFFPTIGLLLHLSTLFPLRKLRSLAAHVEMGPGLLSVDQVENAVLGYFFQPSKLRSNFHTSVGVAQFRSLWLLIDHYGFATEALTFSSRTIKQDLAVKSHGTGAAQHAAAPLLTPAQAQQIRLLAASATPLLFMCSSDMTQSLADISVLVRYTDETTNATAESGTLWRALASHQKTLCGRGVDGMPNPWKELTVGELVLLRALTHLELLRGLTGSIANLTTYQHFEIREFVASKAIQPALTLVMSAVCTHYVNTLRAFAPATTYSLVSRDLMQLVLLVGFAIDSERGCAAMILDMIICTFPALTVYSHALPLLWSVLNVVQGGSAAEVENFCRRAHYDGTPAVHPARDSAARAALVQQLTAIATKWADKALEAAPLALFDLATGFVLQQSVGGEVAGDADKRMGSYLAMQAAQPRDLRRQRDAVLAGAVSVAPVQAVGSARIPSYAQLLIRRSTAQGQVLAAARFSSLAGLEQLALHQFRRSLVSQRHALPRTVFGDLVARVTEVVRATRIVNAKQREARRRLSWQVDDTTAEDEDVNASAATRRGTARISSVAVSQIESTLSTAAAVLCTGLCSPSAQWQLLRHIVHSPVRLFNSDIIEAATGAWSWIISVDGGSLSIPLLTALARAIEWTVTHGLGLFDGVCTSQNLVVQTGDSAAQVRDNTRYKADYNTRSPHSLLFAFLADNFADPNNPISQSPVVVQTLHRLCLRLVERVERLSLKDASFAETMRAMVLVGQVARNVHVMNQRRQQQGLSVVVPFASLGVLRQRWYAAVLHWFRKLPPSWYFAADPALATKELAVLDALMRLLRDDERALARSVTGFLDFSMPVRYEAGDGADDDDHGASPHNNSHHHHHTKRASQQAAPAYKVTPASMIWTISSGVREHTAAVLAASDPEPALRQLIADEQKRLGRLLPLLRVLVQHEGVRIRVWQAPRRTLLVDACVPITDWRDHVTVASLHDPAVVIAMASRFSSIAEVRDAAVALVGATPEQYVTLPEAVDLYLTQEVLEAGAPKLFLFRNCTITQGLRFLDERFSAYPEVGRYAIRSLLACKSEYLIFYLPQLLQVLATDKSGSIQNFLQRMAAKSVVFCHQLLWSLQTEGEGETELARRCRGLADQIKKAMSPEALQFYQNEFAFTALVTSLSGELMNFEKPQRKPNLRKRLVDAEFHVAPQSQHVYLATDPHYRIVEVIPRTAGAMQSAAKCPILVQFQCVPRGLSDMRMPSANGSGGNATAASTSTAVVPQDGEAHGEEEDANAPLPPVDRSAVVVKACIFKMGDDCRQDQISLQLIGLMQRIFDAVGVPSYLYPYRVVTTGQDSGIIEVVPHSVSRNEIGKLVESNLAEYFVQTFGHPESVRFKRARQEFIKSTAAYSIASYILNIKDRHNGNIMIDEKGHLVHIDFGFLFDTSPGGDINFESSPFKLTTEMVQLIGKDVGVSNLRSKSLTKALVDEESYIYFKTLVIRCYLAVRQYSREICVLVELMLRSGLPCFKPKQTIANLAKRLAVDMAEIEAAHFMRRRIHEARENYRTRLYDWYQKKFEGIEM